MAFDVYRGQQVAALDITRDLGVRKLVAIGDLFVIVTAALFYFHANVDVVKWIAIGNLIFLFIRALVLLGSSGGGNAERPRMSLGISDRKETNP